MTSLIAAPARAALRQTDFMPVSSIESIKNKHVKATRQDWIEAALAALSSTPIDELRILTLARQLSVSRSSFYWYFEKPTDLTDELLVLWERNTESIVERAGRESSTIVSACLGVFECWADPRLYHAGLDLAVREWGRRDGEIGARVAAADQARLDAVMAMFTAHDFEPNNALVRARLLYHSQLGYYTLGTDEPIGTRLAYLPYYLEAMCGQSPTSDELAGFEALVGDSST